MRPVFLLSLGLTSALLAIGCSGGAGTPEWADAEQIDAAHPFNATELRMKAGPDGRTLAVWQRGDVDRWRVAASWYEPGLGWGPVTTLDRGEGDAILPDVAVDAAGRAVVVWAQGTGERSRVWVSRYAPTEGWLEPEPLDEDEGGASYDPRIAGDPDGNAVVVWSHANDSLVQLVSRAFDEQQGWGPTEPVKQVAADDAWLGSLGVDDSGNYAAT